MNIQYNVFKYYHYETLMHKNTTVTTEDSNKEEITIMAEYVTEFYIKEANIRFENSSNQFAYT